MLASYVDTIAHYYPTRQVRANGDGYSYDLLEALDGLPLPEKSVLDVQSLQLAQLRVWRLIQAERDRRKFNGVKIGSNWFHTDDSSRIQQIGLLMMGANLPPIQWKTMGGTFVLMTSTLAQQIFQGTAQQDIALFTIAEQHRAMMLAQPIPSLYDYSTMWPPTFISTDPI